MNSANRLHKLKRIIEHTIRMMKDKNITFKLTYFEGLDRQDFRKKMRSEIVSVREYGQVP